jgi:hypothetical protein
MNHWFFPKIERNITCYVIPFFFRLSSSAIMLKYCITACYKVLFPVTTLITPVTRNSVMPLGMGKIPHRLPCRVVGCLPALYLPKPPSFWSDAFTFYSWLYHATGPNITCYVRPCFTVSYPAFNMQPFVYKGVTKYQIFSKPSEHLLRVTVLCYG